MLIFSEVDAPFPGPELSDDVSLSDAEALEDKTSACVFDATLEEELPAVDLVDELFEDELSLAELLDDEVSVAELLEDELSVLELLDDELLEDVLLDDELLEVELLVVELLLLTDPTLISVAPGCVAAFPDVVDATTTSLNKPSQRVVSLDFS